MLDKILVVIFTYNEEDKISLVLQKVCERFKNVLVVDNNSTDKTIEIVKKFSVYYVKHKYNLGKSNSMKTGLNFAELNHFKYVNYKEAVKIHSLQLDNDDKEYLFLLNQRLKNLNIVIKKSSFMPIFITQVKFNGLAERRMFLVNEEIKKFAKKNNYKVIPLDELIEEMSI